jgi:hypothetical protein
VSIVTLSHGLGVNVGPGVSPGASEVTGGVVLFVICCPMFLKRADGLYNILYI